MQEIQDALGMEVQDAQVEITKDTSGPGPEDDATYLARITAAKEKSRAEFWKNHPTESYPTDRAGVNPGVARRRKEKKPERHDPHSWVPDQSAEQYQSFTFTAGHGNSQDGLYYGNPGPENLAEKGTGDNEESDDDEDGDDDENGDDEENGDDDENGDDEEDGDDDDEEDGDDDDDDEDGDDEPAGQQPQSVSGAQDGNNSGAIESSPESGSDGSESEDDATAQENEHDGPVDDTKPWRESSKRYPRKQPLKQPLRQKKSTRRGADSALSSKERQVPAFDNKVHKLALYNRQLKAWNKARAEWLKKPCNAGKKYRVAKPTDPAIHRVSRGVGKFQPIFCISRF
jgi:hypothetical protein